MAIVKTACTDGRTRRAIERAVLRHGLDRRKVYTVSMWSMTVNVVSTLEYVTLPCSGCTCDCGDGYPCAHGAGGCRECGYTGKRRMPFSDPVFVRGEVVPIGRRKAE